MQLVANDIPIGTDGILGRDFLSQYKCNIDYDKYVLTFDINDESIAIPIHDSAFNINQVIIPQRSEIILPFSTKLEEDAVVLNRELTQGVYLANAIIQKIGNQHVKLLNVTDETIIIDNMKVETVPF